MHIVKEDDTYKARYVATGQNQYMKGLDSSETFSPTANLTSPRALMLLAAQYDLGLNQMEGKAAHLHVPIDCRIHIDQPEGSQFQQKNGAQLVCKLNKSINNLKKSGSNWNMMLWDFFD